MIVHADLNPDFEHGNLLVKHDLDFPCTITIGNRPTLITDEYTAINEVTSDDFFLPLARMNIKVTVRELDYYIPDVEPPSLKHMTITGYKREAQILFDPACPKTLKHTSKAKGGFSPALKSLLRAHAQGRGCVQKKKAIGTERGV